MEKDATHANADKIDFKTKPLTKGKEGHYIMTKASIQEENITLINISSEKHKSKPWITLVRMVSSKCLQIINISEDVEKKKHLHTFGGNVNSCSHDGKFSGGSSKHYK